MLRLAWHQRVSDGHSAASQTCETERWGGAGEGRVYWQCWGACWGDKPAKPATTSRRLQQCELCNFSLCAAGLSGRLR